MIRYKRAMKAMSEVQEALTWETPSGWRVGNRDSPTSPTAALKVSAFYRAIDVRSDSIGKFPVCVKALRTRTEVTSHPLGPVLWERSNEAMCPFIYNKLVEYQRVVIGNTYVWLIRDRHGHIVEEIPLPPGTCRPKVDPNTGKLWYVAVNTRTGEMHRLSPADILHYKGFSVDGLEGISLLAYAAQALRTAMARDQYELAVYENGGHPAGVLQTETDLSSQHDLEVNGEKISYKDVVRREWDRIHAGAGNALRVAVLDNGLKYSAVSMTNSDAQFVENKAVSVEDICRFVGVPMHLVYAGKQSYESNEANSIDYVKNTLQPAVTQYEQEDSFKMLTVSERRAGLWLPRNMLAELRGDTAARKEWYRAMREIGVYSVNDIRTKEDEPDVPGGDTRQASLNFVPLELFNELSMSRNKELSITAALFKVLKEADSGKS